MFTPSADGGHALYTRELLGALVRHELGGDRFELVTSEDLAPSFRVAPYPIHAILPRLAHRQAFQTRLGWATNRLLHYPRREWTFLSWLSRRPGVALVHIQEQRPWLAVPLFSRIRRMRKRLFYTVHNVTPNTYPPFVPAALIRRWNRDACRMCDGLFVHTRRLRDQLAGELGRPHPPIHVVPHGVWTVAPDAQGAPRDGAASLDQRLARKRLLFFGAIRRNKGLHVLLDAMEQLPQFSLTVAGEPREPDYVRREIIPRIRRLRELGRSVDFRDRFVPDEDVPPLFADHSAVVLPYTRAFAAQSGVVFLCLAHNTPAIASESGGLRELFDEYRIGECVADVTPEGLARGVRSFFDTRGRDLANEIRAAREHYSWERAAAATLAAYLATFSLSRYSGRGQG